MEFIHTYTTVYDDIKITAFSIDNKTCSNFSKSSPSPKTENQVIKWGEPVTLSGIYSQKEFDNCCFLGETEKSKYHHLELDKPISKLMTILLT